MSRFPPRHATSRHASALSSWALRIATVGVLALLVLQVLRR
jgi:hypothetical protein